MEIEIILSVIVVALLLVLFFVRKDEEKNFEIWLNKYFVEKEVDVNLLRSIYIIEKDPDKAWEMHNHYKSVKIKEES